ncbi:MAG: phospholipase D-like domain-containing protein [Candidatus Aenigmatarchaeota archaeon]
MQRKAIFYKTKTSFSFSKKYMPNGKINFFTLSLIFAFILIFSLIIIFQNSSCKKTIEINENEVDILLDNDYFIKTISLIKSANKSIHILLYNLNYYVNYPESKVNLLIDELEKAAKRGVEVKIIVDDYATEKPVLTILKNKGINIKYDSKDITTHAKLIIIDSKIIIIGSTNWSYYALEKNHEANIILYSSEIANEMEKYFEKIWGEV